MPYYGSLSLPFMSRLSTRQEFRFASWIKSPWDGNNVTSSDTIRGNMHSSFRIGTNANAKRNVFIPIGVPKFRQKRVFLGYEDVESKSIRRFQRKDGSVGFKILTRTKSKKRWGTILVYSYSSYKVKAGVYLKPNQLQMNAASYTQTPFETPYSVMFSYNYPGAPMKIGTIVKGVITGDHQMTDTHMDAVYASRRFSVSVGPVINGPKILLERPSITQLMKDRALQKLYEKITDETPNYYTMLAESGETLDTLRSIAMGGLRLAKDLYRLDGKALKKRSKDFNLQNAASTYLSWIYGISPLISDLKKAVDNYSREARVWRTFSAGVTSPVTNVEVSSQWLDGKQEYYRREYCRYGITLEGDISFSSLLSRSQSWEQTAATVYEVIPFSFMLDWLVDISGYLNSVNVITGRAYNAWYTEGLVTYRRETGKPRLTQPSPNPNDLAIGLSLPKLEIVNNSIYCERVVLSSLPPMPKPIVPTSSQLLDGVSLQRGINALAIAVSRQYGLKDRWSREITSRKPPNLNLTGL